MPLQTPGQFVEITDGAGTQVAVKQNGVQASATDNALVVTLSPNTAGGSGPGSTLVEQGQAAAVGGAWPITITDTVDGPAAVLPGNTTTTASDVALVVALSPNGKANQGTAAAAASAWPVKLTDAGGVNQATISAAGAVKVDGSAVTQPVSGTVTTTPSGTQTISGTTTANQGTANAAVAWNVTAGGTTTTAVAAGTAADTPIKASAGRLCRVLVTSTAGAVATQIFDNATAGTGKIIGILPAAVAVGTVVEFSMPAANGITVLGAVTNPAMTISFQ